MMSIHERVDEVVDEFADLDGREKLELLVDFANGLPSLPPSYEARKTVEDRRVAECQTPVFLWVESDEGRARVVAEVAPEAPTVKGFVALLADLVNGRPLAEAAAVPEDLVDRIGLSDVLGILRARGLRAITGRVRRGLASLLTA